MKKISLILFCILIIQNCSSKESKSSSKQQVAEHINFDKKYDLLYEEIKSFADKDECITFLARIDKNRVDYVNSNKLFLYKEFEKLSIFNKNRYEFIQPMRLNILSMYN